MTVDVNSAIIDQNLVSVCEKIRDRAREVLSIKNDEDKLKSLAFVYLCVSTVLDLSDEETFDCLTEGGGEFGIDALYMSEVLDGEFDISLFQGKYKKDKEFSANSNFAETGILKLVNAIKYLFDPHSTVKEINPRLMKKMEEIRSLVSDGLIPNVRVYACNNGIRWNAAGDEHIERAAFGEQVSWEHVNHDTLVSIFQRPKGIDDFIQFTGKATVEDLEFVRVLIGRVAVSEIHDLVQRHGLRMLDRNIRRYLGLKGNRVNEAIRETLIKDDDRNNFYFYNNGITLTCDKFSYNALQGGDFRVRVDNLHIINGGQTCITIHRTLGTQ
ncbi:MAG: AIPR family protein, partial [Candidatus Magnetominusculus sp. LBB02]|nr:AIPR family protein [Candidatus Magnetominusculus sp. LBB02]